jgi:hypothetical protein
VRRLEVGSAQSAPHAVIGYQLVHPGQTFEMVAVKFALGRAA